MNLYTLGSQFSRIEQSGRDSDSFDYNWVSEQLRQCREIEASYDLYTEYE